MNNASKQRIMIARSVAAIYAVHPDVGSIIVGGSAARTVAHELSDIDLGIFWNRLPTEEERNNLIPKVGGRLKRHVDNNLRFSSDNPRKEGLIEIIDLPPVDDFHVMEMDIEHETVEGTNQVLSQVIDQLDISLEKQELVSVIHDGIVLHGYNLVDQWRARSISYPQNYAEKMVAEHFSGIGLNLQEQIRWIKAKEWFYLYEGFLKIGRQLFLTLMGLNRKWVFTDNSNFKGWNTFADKLELKPEQFASRLGQAYQQRAPLAIQDLVTLSEEVLELIAVHMPTVDISTEGELMKRTKDNLNL